MLLREREMVDVEKAKVKVGLSASCSVRLVRPCPVALSFVGMGMSEGEWQPYYLLDIYVYFHCIQKIRVCGTNDDALLIFISSSH